VAFGRYAAADAQIFSGPGEFISGPHANAESFGPPTETTPGSEGLPNHRWVFPGFEIVHVVYDRFGPEEHMRIRPTSRPSGGRDRPPMRRNGVAGIISLVRSLLGRRPGR